MIKHFFKIIWNRKKTNFTTSLGVFIAFIVLFLVMSFIVYTAKNYLAPLGFEYKDVWYITMDWKDSSKEEVKETLIQMENSLSGYEEIKKSAFSRAYIFIPSVMSMDNFEFNDKEFRTELRKGSDSFEEVLGLNIVEGRWFNETDNAATKHPLVINEKVKDEIFGDDFALGSILKRGETEYQVIGVIDEFKNGGLFSSTKRIAFQRISLNSEVELSRLKSDVMGSRILLKMRPNTSIEFEETIMKNLSGIAKNWQIKVNSLDALKSSASLQSLIFPIIFAVVCGFLIINVGLGLFGVIWYNTNRRRAEIGLRRAMGSSANMIHTQIIGEALVLSTLAMIFGSFFALQFPILGLIPMFDSTIYTLSYIISVLVIYLITSLCAWYPSRVAASIEPADALRDE